MAIPFRADGRRVSFPNREGSLTEPSLFPDAQKTCFSLTTALRAQLVLLEFPEGLEVRAGVVFGNGLG